MSTVTAPPSLPKSPAPNSLLGQIWIRENRISSYGMTRLTLLEGLDAQSRELWGQLVRADGRSKLNGIFKWEPYLAGKNVTQDGFDQVEMYVSLDQVQRYLMRLGINVPGILANRHGGKSHAVVAHANAVPDMNAWYAPQTDDLSFGSSNDKWHLASDSDITIHEYGHLLLDHIAPGISGRFGGEGNAIHEAFGDILASLYHADPEIGEDFGPAVGQKGNPAGGLRTVNNALTLEQAGLEPHDRSLAYSGMFWQLKTQLMHPRGNFKMNDRVAANLMLQIVVNHAYFYTTRSPKPRDFVVAILSTIDQMDKQKTLPVDRAAFRKIVLAEALRRHLVTETEAKALEFNIRPAVSSEDFTASLKQFGPAVQFVSSHAVPADWGKMEYLQQQVDTRAYGKVDVANSGIAVWRDTQGDVTDYSLDDVRQVPAGSIDETVKTDYNAAIQMALSNAQQRLSDRTAALNKVKSQSSDPRVTAPFEMSVRLAKTSADSLTQMNQRLHAGTAQPAKFVLLPGKNTLHYEFKLGLEIAYIDAKTGAVTFHEDVFTH